MCNLLKPRREILHTVGGLGLNGEREEDGLRSIFGVVGVAKHLKADVENHARVTAHDLFERLLSAEAHKLPEKILSALGERVPLTNQEGLRLRDAIVED